MSKPRCEAPSFRKSSIEQAENHLEVNICRAPSVHGDYSEDVGVKVDKLAEETMAEGITEVIGAIF
ncbi:40S ribosomal protein S3a-like [Senna tora]|uniref:40S ribosomal protein S3a-like n=1 Tax=Senna tora TaxID=362788 RepID=A0A834XC47_9FABA|nr:40S ribosomal protein S3a-like [Senna tora]